MSTIGGDAPARRIWPRWKVLGLGAALLVLALIAAALLTPPVEVRITEAQARDALQAQIGEPKSVLTSRTTITPLSLEPEFRADNRASVSAQLQLDGFGRKAVAAGTISGGIRYNSPHVFLSDIDATGLSLVGAEASKTRSLASDVLSVVRDRARRERDETSDPEARAALDRLAERAEASVPELAVRGAEAVLSTIPVYDLNDAGLKGSVAALALQDVRFEQDAVVLTLSARAAMIRIVTFIGLMLLVLLYFTWSYLLGRAFDAAGEAVIKAVAGQPDERR